MTRRLPPCATMQGTSTPIQRVRRGGPGAGDEGLQRLAACRPGAPVEFQRRLAHKLSEQPFAQPRRRVHRHGEPAGDGLRGLIGARIAAGLDAADVAGLCELLCGALGLCASGIVQRDDRALHDEAGIAGRLAMPEKIEPPHPGPKLRRCGGESAKLLAAPDHRGRVKARRPASGPPPPKAACPAVRPAPPHCARPGAAPAPRPSPRRRSAPARPAPPPRPGPDAPRSA